MCNDYSDIGFRMESQIEATPFAVRALKEGKRTTFAWGSYVDWSPGAGVRLWLLLTPEGKFGALSPDYESDCVTPMRLVARRPDKGYEATGGIEAGWGEHGSVMFDVPDFRVFDSLSLPVDALVRLTAFAKGQLTVHESDEAYYAATRESLGLASEAYISSGFMLPGGQPRTPPKAWASFFGHVLAAETRVNPVTGLQFVWARVSSLGVTVEIVADPKRVPRAPTVGGVIGGQFWLSGRPMLPGRGFADRL